MNMTAKLRIGIIAITSFIFTVTSCEKKSTDIVGTGKLVFSTTVHNQEDIVIGKKSTSENDPISVLVKSIEVKTENAEGDKTSNSFNLLDDEGNAIESHTISPIPFGMTDIVANTITPDGNSKEEMNYIDNLDDIKELVDKPPYIIYTGSAKVDIKNKEVAHATLDMNTENGKMVVSFSPERADVLSNYKIQIQQGDKELEMTETEGHNNVYFYWSNENALDGSIAEFTVNWINKDNEIVHTTKLDDFKIKKGVSTYYKVLVSDNNVIEKPVEETELVLTFTFKPITSEEVDVNI